MNPKSKSKLKTGLKIAGGVALGLAALSVASDQNQKRKQRALDLQFTRDSIASWDSRLPALSLEKAKGWQNYKNSTPVWHDSVVSSHYHESPDFYDV